MPKAWSNKDERQYEHIKDSYKHRGVSNDEAEERAARTVNKERHAEGRTKEQREQRASGARSSSRSRSHDEPTKEELYDRARKLGIEGRSKMDKEQLTRAIQRKR
jgi:plasmid stabilization system protein ParE